MPVKVDEKARKVIARLLREQRWDDQDGYVNYQGKGKWSFVQTSLGYLMPAELNALFKFAGIVPDVIVPKGYCSTCHFAIKGRERGYSPPCAGCKRPKMPNYEPKCGLKLVRAP